MTVKEKQVQVIVNLSSLEDNGAFHGEEEEEEWPSRVKEVGNGLKVELLNKDKERLIWKRYSDVSLFLDAIASVQMALSQSKAFSNLAISSNLKQS